MNIQIHTLLNIYYFLGQILHFKLNSEQSSKRLPTLTFYNLWIASNTKSIEIDFRTVSTSGQQVSTALFDCGPARTGHAWESQERDQTTRNNTCDNSKTVFTLQVKLVQKFLIDI